MKKLLLAFALLILVIAAFYAFNSTPVQETPQADLYEGWSEATTNGVGFRFPEVLPTMYVCAAEWPPVLERTDAYSCTAEERVISGTTYCVQETGEGAAGSTFITYVYEKAGVRGTFTLRFPQCLNYDQPQQGTCQLEQQSLDVDTLADRILSSAR